MIRDGFTYIAVLTALAALLIGLEKKTKWKIFKSLPPIVFLYLLAMVLCTLNAWDLEATQKTYIAMKNNLLFTMIFLMLLRCDIRKILKLGPRMLGGFFAASISIVIGFIATYALLHTPLGANAWKGLAAVCGSWLGGSGNLIAIQAALDISEGDMARVLIIDLIDDSIWVVFLFWVIGFAPKFNKWTKSNTNALDSICKKLEGNTDAENNPITFASLIILLGTGLMASALSQKAAVALYGAIPFLDTTTWTVVVVTLVGLICSPTPLGRTAGSTELSNVFLYIVIALLASRANLTELADAPLWIAAGLLVLLLHGIILLLIAKIFKLDMFTCAVASLANIGGTATAPILAGTYSPALVPVGVLMALMGYVIGTGGGLLVARIMRLFA